MNVVLAFPFRDDEEFTRSAALQVVKDRVSRMYPFSDVMTVDTQDVVFNRAATRNRAVEIAEAKSADVVVICDADSIPERAPLNEAIEQAAVDGMIHYPFNEVWEMAPKAIHLVRVGRNTTQMRNRAIHRYGPSQGGIWVVRPQSWWAAGGQDERLAGWGCEDRAFLAAANTLVGNAVHHEGVLMCLYHRRPPIAQQWMKNDVALLTRYETAVGNPYETRAIINERLNRVGAVTWPPEGS